MTGRRLALILCGVVLLVGICAPVIYVQAQTEPTAIIDAAFKDLSQRLGKSIARGGNSSFVWEMDAFPDSSLGCPQPGKAYSQIVTQGYKITITYQGTAYDYRATKDGSVLFQCVATAGNAPTSTPNNPVTPTAAPGNTSGLNLTNALAFVTRSGNVSIVPPGNPTFIPVTVDSALQQSQTAPFSSQTRAYGQLRWSPDGIKLLFTDLANRTLYLVISGQPPLKVTAGLSGAYPGVWSPDGSKIAYAVQAQPNAQGEVIDQVQAIPLNGTALGAPQFAGSFVEKGTGCGGADPDPADTLYNTETASLGGNGLTLAWVAQGFVHSINCSGTGLSLTGFNGQDLWTVQDIARVAVAPNGARAAGIQKSGALVMVDIASGNVSPFQAQPGGDQVAWSGDNATIYYSTLKASQQVTGNAGSPVGSQLFGSLWPVTSTDNTVTLWRAPVSGGPSSQVFQRNGRAIGVIAPAPNNSAVAFSFVSSDNEMLMQINSNAAASQALLIQPQVTIFYVPLDSSGGPVVDQVTSTQGGQPAFGSGLFAAAAAPGPTIGPTANLAPPALVIGGQAIVTTTRGDTLNMRQAPGLSAKVLRILKPGAIVTILDGPQSVDSLRWWQVRADDGSTGWVVDQVTDQDGTVNTLVPQ